MSEYEKGEIFAEQILILLKSNEEFCNGYLDKINEWLLDRYEEY